MRGSVLSIPEGPHALKSTGSLLVSRRFSEADMLKGKGCAHATSSIPYSNYEDGDLHRVIHIIFE